MIWGNIVRALTHLFLRSEGMAITEGVSFLFLSGCVYRKFTVNAQNHYLNFFYAIDLRAGLM